MEAGAAGGAGGGFSRKNNVVWDRRNKVVWDGPVMPSPNFRAGGALNFGLEIMHFAGGAGGAFSPRNNIVWEGAGIVSPSSAPEARAKY